MRAILFVFMNIFGRVKADRWRGGQGYRFSGAAGDQIRARGPWVGERLGGVYSGRRLGEGSGGGGGLAKRAAEGRRRS